MEVSTVMGFTQKSCLFQESGEQRESTSINVAEILKKLSLHLTQGTIRTAKESCSYCYKHFIFFDKNYLNWVTMGQIMSYIQLIVTVIFLV